MKSARKFSEEQMKNIAHEIALQTCSAIETSLRRKKVKEYIETYCEILQMLETYNDAEEIPVP